MDLKQTQSKKFKQIVITGELFEQQCWVHIL